jgi:hypothetical protein
LEIWSTSSKLGWWHNSWRQATTKQQCCVKGVCIGNKIQSSPQMGWKVDKDCRRIKLSKWLFIRLVSTIFWGIDHLQNLFLLECLFLWSHLVL